MDYKTITSRYYYKDGNLYYKEDISSRARKDQLVGSISSRGYREIRTWDNGIRRCLMLHRVVYCYFNECGYYDIEGWDVDHLNNDKLDNRIENLILCEHWENQLNRIDTKRNGGLYDQNKRQRERYKTDKVYREKCKERQRMCYKIKKSKDT
jgi:hypothetical protein